MDPGRETEEQIEQTVRTGQSSLEQNTEANGLSKRIRQDVEEKALFL